MCEDIKELLTGGSDTGISIETILIYIFIHFKYCLVLTLFIWFFFIVIRVSSFFFPFCLFLEKLFFKYFVFQSCIKKIFCCSLIKRHWGTLVLCGVAWGFHLRICILLWNQDVAIVNVYLRTGWSVYSYSFKTGLKVPVIHKFACCIFASISSVLFYFAFEHWAEGIFFFLNKALVWKWRFWGGVFKGRQAWRKGFVVFPMPYLTPLKTN